MLGRFFHDEKKIWLIVKTVSTIVVLFMVIAIVFNYFDISLGIKITLTLITVLLAIVDIYNNYQKSDKSIFESKRTWMIFLAICWFLFTVWGNINNQNQELRQAERADSLSIVVADRTDKIIRDINLSLGALKKSGQDIDEVDSLLIKVKDTLEFQVDLLNQAVGKSKEIYDLENKKLSLNRPEITILSAEVKFITSPKDSLKYSIKLNFLNYKERPANNWKYSTCLIIKNTENTRKNIFFGNYGLWSEPAQIAGGGSVKRFSEIHFDLDKKVFNKDYGIAILIIRTKYSDEYDNSEFYDDIFLTCRYSMYNNLQFHDAINEEKRFAISYLKELNSSYLNSE